MLAALRREMRGIIISLLLVAVTTAVAMFLRHYIGILRGAVLYLVPVMLAGYQFGVIPALVAAIAGVLLSGYVYFAQLYSFQVASPQEALNLLLFMVVAVVVSHLSSQAKKHILIARKREREMSDLYAFSRRLAMAPSAAEIFVAIQEHLAHLVQRKVVLLGIADAGAANDVPETVRAAVTRVEHDEGLERTVDDGKGNIWLIRRVSPKTTDFGLVAVDLGNVSGQPLADMRQRIDDALADAAATLERLDVARALNEAKMRSETELLREALIGSAPPPSCTTRRRWPATRGCRLWPPWCATKPSASISTSRTCSMPPPSAGSRCGRNCNGSSRSTSSTPRSSTAAAV